MFVAGDIIEVIKDYDPLRVSLGDRAFIKGLYYSQKYYNQRTRNHRNMQCYKLQAHFYSRLPNFGSHVVDVSNNYLKNKVWKIVGHVDNPNFTSPELLPDRREHFYSTLQEISKQLNNVRDIWQYDLRFADNRKKLEDFLLKVVDLEPGLSCAEIVINFFYSLGIAPNGAGSYQRLLKYIENALTKISGTLRISSSSDSGLIRYYPPTLFP